MKKILFVFALLLATCVPWAQALPPGPVDYLCFTANTAGSTIELIKINTPTAVTIQFQVNGTAEGGWTSVDFSTVSTTGQITLVNAGDKVYFRNASSEVTGFSIAADNYYKFLMSGSIAASGNVMSLVDKSCQTTTIPCNSCFENLFQNCSTLTVAPALPATTLANTCYSNMFQGCSSLTTAPALPATTLADSCYRYMFRNCSALTVAPALPAETLATACYNYMFESCSTLTVAPALPATNLATNCYGNMFRYCTSLTAAPALPAETLAVQCYSAMFLNCTSLTTAPALPAETLANDCYRQMFVKCSSLTTAPELPATTLANSCYASMFQMCTALTTAPELPAETLAVQCYAGMFQACTTLTTPPALPATTLANQCYQGMFQACSTLTTLPTLPATTLANNCYQSMFQACTALEVDTTAPGVEWSIPAEATVASYATSNMFSATGGDFTGEPVPGTTYYIASALPPTVTEAYVPTDETGVAKSEWGSTSNQAGNIVDIDATPSVHLYAMSGPETGWTEGSTLPLTPVYDNGWTVRNNRNNVWDDAISRTKTLYFVNGKGTSTTGIAFAEQNDGTYRVCYNKQNDPTGPWYAEDGTTELTGDFDFTYKPDGSNGMPKYGPYYKLTSKHNGTMKVLVWNNKGGRPVYVVDNTTHVALNPLTGEVQYSGYVNGRDECIDPDDESRGKKMIFYETLAPQTTNPYCPQAQIAANQTAWVYLTFSVNANQTYWIFNNDKLGFGGFEFTPDSVPAPTSATVTANVNDTAMGSVTGAGNYTAGSTATLTANAKEGYRFSNWTNANGGIVSTANPWTLTVAGDTAVTANFAPLSVEVQEEVDVPAITYDYALGYAGASSTFDFSMVYDAIGCYANDAIVYGYNPTTDDYIPRAMSTYDGFFSAAGVPTASNSTSTPFCIKFYNDGTFWYCTHPDVAEYGAHYTCSWILVNPETGDAVQYNFSMNDITRTANITANVNNTAMGSASGSGTYNIGSTATLTATANEGIEFLNWTNANTGDILSTDNPWTVTIEQDTSIVANFDTASFNLTVSVADGMDALGSVAGSGHFRYMRTQQISASPIEHYHVVWNDGNTDNNRSIVMPAHNTTFVASFAIDQHAVATFVNNATMGEVTAGGTYDYGSQITLTATPAAHYHFVAWSNGATDNPFVFTLVQDTNLTAIFEIDTHTVALAANDATFGTVNGAGTYNYGTQVTLTATPAAHYHFVAWSNGATDNPFVFTLVQDTNLTAIFEIDTHTVALAANDATFGTVSGAGTYDYGTQVTAIAVPAAHYHFVNWSNGSTNDTIVIDLAGDINLVANFAIDQHDVATSVNDEAWGEVAGDGTYDYGAQVTLTATPAAEYRFTNWSNANTGTILGTANPWTFTVEQDTNVVANFERDEYTISLYTNDNTMGTVSGGGTYLNGTSVTITATANEHYHFDQWNNGSTSPSYTFTVTSNQTFVAQFLADQYTVLALANDDTMGSVEGSGVYDYNTEVVLTATANEHYHFVGWSNGETATSIIVQPSSDTTITATFAPDMFTLTVLANDTAMGIVTGAGDYAYGTVATLTAAPIDNYHFVRWSNGDTAETIAVLVERDTTLTAIFAANIYYVTAVANDDQMGSVTGSGYYGYGETATLTASATEGHHFVAWSNGKTARIIEVTVESDTTLTATFAIDQFTVTAAANSDVMGSVTGSGNYDYGETATLTASATAGHHFVAWSNGDTAETIAVLVERDTTLTAIFAANTYHITAVADDDLMGSVAGSGDYDYGETATLSASATEGYHFVKWTDDNTDNPRNFTVTCDSSFTALFAENGYNVTATVNIAESGTVTGTGDYPHLGHATLTATAAPCYHFVRWNDGVTDNVRVVEVVSDTAFEAIFELNVYESEFDHTACDSYTWDSNTYVVGGDYQHVYPTLHGCDSTVTLHLTVNHGSHNAITETACESFTWNGETYTTSGTKTFDYTNADGCASVDTLHLTINHGSHNAVTETACESFTWNGETYTTSGDKTFDYTNEEGCASVDTLHLTIGLGTHNATTETACDSYVWHGVTYTTSGTKTFNYTDAEGCASVDTLHLTVNHGTHNAETETACDSFTWNGETYTISGDWTHAYTNEDGCASVDTLHLTVNHGTHNSATESACESYTWHGETYTTSGDKTFAYTNADGCASVDTLHLTVNHGTHNATTETACDSYVWHGVTYTTSGTKTFNYTDADGCASVDTLHLTINHGTHNAVTETACDSFTWNGETYTTSGDKTFAYTNADGCASVDTLHLTVNLGSHNAVTETACETYTWNGVTYTTSGDKTFDYTNEEGCASVDTLHLTVNHGTHNATTETACDSYIWNGETYTTSGDKTFSYTNEVGCASVDTLHLTINHGTHNAVTETACDSFTWNGETYTTSGDKTFDYTNEEGCASVDTLHLTINHGTHNAVTETSCDSFTWNGETYTTSGDKTFDYTNEEGCASVDTLHLTVNLGSTGVDEQSACDHFTWINGITYTSDNFTDQYTLTNAANCDSVVTLHLVVNYSNSGEFSEQATFSYIWDGREYTESGNYTFVYQNVYDCDSTVTLHLIVTSFELPVIDQLNKKAVMLSHYPNGDGEYVDYIDYRWYRDGELVAEGFDNFWEPSVLNGCYHVEVPVDETKTQWVLSNELCFQNGVLVGIDEAEAAIFSFSVAPNPVVKGSMMTVTTQLPEQQLQGASLMMFDLNGRIVTTMPMSQQSVTLPAQQTSGVYVIQITTRSGEKYLQKVVVR